MVEAARSGALDVLPLLLRGPEPVEEATLARAFQAATDIGDLKRRADVFRLLLEQELHVDEVDAQLVSAARYGDDGLELVRLLLAFGASTDYKNGEAVFTSTRMAFLPSLELMLGLKDKAEKQRLPSHATMARALKASSELSGEPKYQVVEWLFRAGLPVTEALHTALNKAVREDEPNLRLIQLLLANGASPLANGCQALVDAAEKALVPVLDIFLGPDIPAPRSGLDLRPSLHRRPPGRLAGRSRTHRGQDAPRERRRRRRPGRRIGLGPERLRNRAGRRRPPIRQPPSPARRQRQLRPRSPVAGRRETGRAGRRRPVARREADGRILVHGLPSHLRFRDGRRGGDAGADPPV